MFHKNCHLWGLPSHFWIPCPLKLNPCPKCCKIGYRGTYPSQWDTRNGHSIGFQFRWDLGKSPPRDVEASFSVCLFHNPGSIGTILQVESLVLSIRSRKSLVCFRYICADNRHIVAHFWGNHYWKGGYTLGGIGCGKRGHVFEEWIVQILNVSLARCFDNSHIKVYQIQLCGDVKLVKQVQQGILNSTPNLPRPVI
jgi:hypothetical protein